MYARTLQFHLKHAMNRIFLFIWWTLSMYSDDRIRYTSVWVSFLHKWESRRLATPLPRNHWWRHNYRICFTELCRLLPNYRTWPNHPEPAFYKFGRICVTKKGKHQISLPSCIWNLCSCSELLFLILWKLYYYGDIESVKAACTCPPYILLRDVQVIDYGERRECRTTYTTRRTRQQ